MNRQRVLAVLFLWLMLLLAGAVLVQFRLHHQPDRTPSFRDATPTEASLTKSVVTKQLLCFKRDDFDGAQELQTHNYRPSFSSPEEFRTVVRGMYPEFCTFASVQFGPCMADQQGNRTAIHITLVASNGSDTGAQYVLVRENGLYRVYYVRLDAGPFGRRPAGPPRQNPRDFHLQSGNHPLPPGV